MAAERAHLFAIGIKNRYMHIVYYFHIFSHFLYSKLIYFILQIDQLLHRQSAVEEQLRAAKKLVFIMLVAMIVVLIFLITITNNNLHAHTAAMQSANTIISQASHGEQGSHVEL